MRYEINEIIETLNTLLTDVNITHHIFTKNNNTTYNALVLTKEKSNIGAVVAIDHYLDSADSLYEIAYNIMLSYKNADTEFLEDIEKDILNYEYVKEYLNLKIVSAVYNAEYLRTTCYKQFMDLAIIPYIMLTDNIAGSINVSHDLLKRWDKSFNEVYEDAYNNLLDTEPYIMDLGQFVNEYVDDEMTYESGFIYILSNKTKHLGASMILNTNLMEKMCNKVNGDLLVIPSSIHEVLILGLDDISADAIDDMIQDVNETVVQEIDILSDHAYIYRKNSGWEF